MDVKIDTKEKFAVITPVGPSIPANMTGKLAELLLSYFHKPIPHLVLNLKNITDLSPEAAERISDTQEHFLRGRHSFVICCLQQQAISVFEKLGLLDNMAITPTESEAWDIIQMEEIERELMIDPDSDE